MKFLDNLEKVIVGQDLSTGPTQFSMARRLLSGDTLAQFNNKALALKNKETIQQAKNKTHYTSLREMCESAFRQPVWQTATIRPEIICQTF